MSIGKRLLALPQKDLFSTSRFWYITQRIIIDDLFAITIIS